MRRIRLYSVLVIGSLLALLAGSAPAGALAPNPVHTLAFTVPVTGVSKPYTLNLLAQDLGAGQARVLITLSRTATTSSGHVTERHQWLISNVTFTCSAHVASCNLDTSSANAASAGLIHLTFNPTTTTTTKEDICKFNGHDLGSHTTRAGRVTGTFRLATHTVFFGQIRNTTSVGAHIPASITAKATKWSHSGEGCVKPSCPSYVDLQPSGTDNSHIIANWAPATHKGGAFWDAPSVVVGDVYLFHRVSGYTSHHFLKVTSNSPDALEAMTLNLPFAPFMTGSGSYAGGAPGTVTAPPCVQTTRHGSFTGQWTVKLDGWGTFTSNGTDSNAYAFKEQHT